MNRLIITVIVCLWSVTTTSAAILYVDGSAGGTNDGSSWADAFTNLQTAIDAAEPDTNIWLAEGVYYPPNTGLGRQAAFHLKDGVKIYGGFPSGGANFDQRNPAVYRSILTGDLNDDDAENPESYSDNCYHVLIADDSVGIVLDGLEVTGGNADGTEYFQQRGGGFLANGSATIVNCRFMGNRALYGGGLYCCPRSNIMSSITIRDSRIENNQVAIEGGGVYLGDSNLLFENCVILGNHAAQRGGGIMFGNDNVSSLVGCRILENSAGADGGGMYLMFSFQFSVTDCEISGNQSGECGGGIYHGYDTYMICKQSVFRDNFALDDGGAIYHQQGQPVYESCRFEGNRAVKNGGAICSDNSESLFADCLFKDNQARACIPGSPCDCADGGAICSDGGKTTVIGCRLLDNKGMRGGGIYQWKGVLSVSHSYFRRNLAMDCGGGLFLAGAESRVEQCLFVRNCVDDWGGGAIWNTNGTLDVLNCSIAGNWASDGGNGIQNYDRGHLNVVNSIIRDEVINSSGTGATWTLSYSNILGAGDQGEGTIDEDPMFCEEPSGGCLGGGEGSFGNLRLKEGSPCINAGDNTGVIPGSTDLDERPRIRGGTVDMGAYEYHNTVGNIIYVDDNAVGAGTGADWIDAIQKLQDALAIAKAGQEIHVAQGTYKPADINGARADSFKLNGGVAIRGGYAGLGAMYPDDRDVRRFETILSGDLNGDDQGGWFDPSRMENSFNVVRVYGPISGAVLEGFTITGGYGGPDVYNSGGGLFSHATVGLEVRDCLFRGNLAYQGGGLYDSWSSGCRTTNCVFTGNYGTHGGAVYLNGEFCMTLDHCLIVGNEAEWGGGMYLDEAYTSIDNCTIANNLARDQWGGVMDWPGTSHFWSSIFWGNTCDSENIEWAQVGRKGDFSRFDYCCVQSWTGGFAGVGTIDADPLFADANNGDYHLKSQGGRWDVAAKAWVQDAATSPCIDAGDPISPIMYEPFPNGGVINMGAYGGTAEASKSYFGKPVCTVLTAGDINGDCKIDLGDFAILAAHWLEGYGNEDLR